jgi:hypothetical protein
MTIAKVFPFSDTHDLAPPFHKNNISPHAVHLTDPFPIAYLPKSTFFAQRKTGKVLSQNHSLQGPNTRMF